MKNSLGAKKIKYIAHYNFPESGENRYCALSACTKIDYISKRLKNAGMDIRIISVSTTLDHTHKRVKKVNKNGIDVCFLQSYGRKNTFQKVYSLIMHKLELLRIALFEINNGDTVIVYHSLELIRFVELIIKLKSINLIIEAEEIYGDVMENEEISQREFSYLQNADAYIFPTEIMNSNINVMNKKAVINYGTYDVGMEFDKRKYRDTHGWKKDFIHVVYAGTLDPRKGGAEAAILTAASLPPKYHVHLLGFGSEQEIDYIQKLIKRVDNGSRAIISYDGVLSGVDYTDFLQACDIGLSTQDPSKKFNDTSFPSKILSYMSNGLRVVSAKIPVVAESKINEYVYYYEKQTPEEIAKTIQNIDLSGVSISKEVIKSLDEAFIEEILKVV